MPAGSGGLVLVLLCDLLSAPARCVQSDCSMTTAAPAPLLLLLRSQGRSLTWLAHELGVRRGWLYRRLARPRPGLRGPRGRPPSGAALRRCGEALGLPPGDLASRLGCAAPWAP